MKAIQGCDYIRGEDWKPKERSLNGWLLWARREAERKSKQDRFKWFSSTCFVESRNALRISFAGQPELLR
ncbi:MAG: hypothetical protein WC055_00110 [Melioribacteraceae bacterium]